MSWNEGEIEDDDETIFGPFRGDGDCAKREWLWLQHADHEA
jgi:hypothetical protein